LKSEHGNKSSIHGFLFNPFSSPHKCSIVPIQRRTFTRNRPLGNAGYPHRERLWSRRGRRRPLRVRRELPPASSESGGALHRMVQWRFPVWENDQDYGEEWQERGGEGGGRVRLHARV